MASLPESLAGRPVIVLDPMLATGGSLLHCLQLLASRGADDLTVICALAAPEGLADARGVRAADPAVHRQRRRAAQRERLHRARARRRGRPPVRAAMTRRAAVGCRRRRRAQRRARRVLVRQAAAPPPRAGTVVRTFTAYTAARRPLGDRRRRGDRQLLDVEHRRARLVLGLPLPRRQPHLRSRASRRASGATGCRSPAWPRRGRGPRCCGCRPCRGSPRSTAAARGPWCWATARAAWPRPAPCRRSGGSRSATPAAAAGPQRCCPARHGHPLRRLRQRRRQPRCAG